MSVSVSVSVPWGSSLMAVEDLCVVLKIVALISHIAGKYLHFVLLQIWLIEVNANPCLATNCQVLKTVVPSVVQEALCKAGIPRDQFSS